MYCAKKWQPAPLYTFRELKKESISRCKAWGECSAGNHTALCAVRATPNLPSAARGSVLPVPAGITAPEVSVTALPKPRGEVQTPEGPPHHGILGATLTASVRSKKQLLEAR